MKQVMFVTGIMTGREALRMIADYKAQESIRQTTRRILTDVAADYERQPADRIDRLADFYTSAYVERNMPWLRDVPFEQFVEQRGGAV